MADSGSAAARAMKSANPPWSSDGASSGAAGCRGPWNRSSWQHRRSCAPWLEEHHETAPELVVGLDKKHTGKQGLSWAQLVDEEPFFGRIDGQGRRIDDERHQIRITPRKVLGSILEYSQRHTDGSAGGGEGVCVAAVRAVDRERKMERSGVYSTSASHQRSCRPTRRRGFADTPRLGCGSWRRHRRISGRRPTSS